jgi:hypothetical protein
VSVSSGCLKNGLRSLDEAYALCSLCIRSGLSDELVVRYTPRYLMMSDLGTGISGLEGFCGSQDSQSQCAIGNCCRKIVFRC